VENTRQILEDLIIANVKTLSYDDSKSRK